MSPPAIQLHAHHWLILHGRYVCVARTPLPDCLIRDLCDFEEKTRSPSGMPALRSLPLKPPAGNGGSKAPAVKGGRAATAPAAKNRLRRRTAASARRQLRARAKARAR